MHLPAIIEPLVGVHRQQLLDEAHLDRLVSLARRERTSQSVHARTGSGLFGYVALLAMLGALLAQVFTPIEPAAAPATIASPTLYSMTIAAYVDESPVSIHRSTASPPASATVLPPTPA